MKRIFAAVLAVCASCLGVTASWAASDTSQLPAPIEQCIRTNATKVELAIPDLNQAMTFLVSGICAASIDAEYDRRLKLKEQQSRAEMQKACEQSKSSPLASQGTNSPGSFSPMCQPEIVDSMSNPASTGDDVRAFGMQPHSAEAFSLAAKLLLDLRLAHLNSKSQ
jgi:TolA-binding protein